MKNNPYNPKVVSKDLIISEKISGNYLLTYLQEHLNCSKEKLSNALYHGGIYLNDKRLISHIPSSLEASGKISVYFFENEPQEIQLSQDQILFQKEGILAFNKPAWLPVQGSRASLKFGLQEQLIKLTGIKTLSAAHRLDRQTSGVILFSENKKCEARLMQLFQNSQIEKHYLAWTSSIPEKETWEMKGYLQRDFRRLPLNVYRFYSHPQRHSKFSHSVFKVLERRDEIALIEAQPFTGRTHQIRVHLSYSHCPILGDDLYGGSSDLSDRILLHAHRLNFKWGSQKIELEAPLPADMQNHTVSS